MPAIIPFIPLIAQGVGLAGSAIGAHKNANAAKAAALPAQQVAGQEQQRAGELYGQGMPAIGQAQNYFQTLLSGGRGAMAQATAGPRAQITDVYRGAERGLEHSGIRGAQRDVAKGELGRQQASQIAGLTTGMQPGAAGALGTLGTTLTGQGGAMLGGAGNLYANLLGQSRLERGDQYQRSQDTGGVFGGLLHSMLPLLMGKRGGGAIPNLGAVNPGMLPGYNTGPY